MSHTSATVPATGTATSIRERALRLTPQQKRRLANWAPMGTLVLLMLIFTVISPSFIALGNLQGIAAQCAIPLVLGVGLTGVVLLGAIDLSIQGVMAATMFTFALLVPNNVNDNRFGFLAIVISVSLGAVFGVTNGVLNAYLKIPSFMVTFGIWFVGLGIAQLLMGKRPPRVDGDARQWLVQQRFGIPQMFYIAIALVLVSAAVLRYTRFGRHIYATGGNEELAKVSGVHIRRVKVAVFAIAGACSALGGIFVLGRSGVADVTATDGKMFTTIAGVVLGGTLLSGGRGGVLQSSVGIVIMIVLRNGMIMIGVPSLLQDAVEGVIVITAVVAMNWSSRARLRVVS